MVSMREAWTTHGKDSNYWLGETLTNHLKACGLEPRPRAWEQGLAQARKLKVKQGRLHHQKRGSLSLSSFMNSNPPLSYFWKLPSLSCKWTSSPLSSLCTKGQTGFWGGMLALKTLYFNFLKGSLNAKLNHPPLVHFKREGNTNDSSPSPFLHHGAHM